MATRRRAEQALCEPEPRGAREPTRRLFFALWPEEALRTALSRATRKAVRVSGGRPVPTESLHVTLAFLGQVPESRLVELGALAQEAARVAPGPPLELLLNRLEHWAAAQILCAAPSRAPASVDELAQRLNRRLQASGFASDLKPFRPHVTVARKVRRPPRASMDPLLWRFCSFALMESRTASSGAVYSVVETYPLSGAANAAK